MHASLFLIAAATFFSGLVSAAPTARQESPLRYGYIANDYLGTVWTKQSPGDASSGIPIGVSPLASGGPTSNQLFAMYSNVDSYGDTTFLFSALDAGTFVSTQQTTSSDNYSPGFWMLQTAATQAGAAYFTILPGNEDGSWYLQPNSPSGSNLDWYHYDDPTASWIPVIMSDQSGGASQSWTWHSVTLNLE